MFVFGLNERSVGSYACLKGCDPLLPHVRFVERGEFEDLQAEQLFGCSFTFEPVGTPGIPDRTERYGYRGRNVAAHREGPAESGRGAGCRVDTARCSRDRLRGIAGCCHVGDIVIEPNQLRRTHCGIETLEDRFDNIFRYDTGNGRAEGMGQLFDSTTEAGRFAVAKTALL